jgi:phosphatidylglycerophosphatase A
LDSRHRDGRQRHVTQITQNRFVVFVARAIATGFGAGFAPVAPGTFGTLVAVPIAWALAPLSLPVYVAVTVAVTVVAIACARIADDSWGTHDTGRIVVDEIAGYLATMALVPRDRALTLAAGFILFRVLDITKPPPARWIDQRLPGGAGVVLDDVTVGLYGAVLLWLGWRYLPHPA